MPDAIDGWSGNGAQADGGQGGAGLFAFRNSYARLPDRFFARLDPTPVAAPALLRLNDALARTLGLDPDRLRAPDGIAALAGNHAPDGAEPLAMAYAGHQFGNFVPQLGDGRAILLGEVVGADGVRRDVQLKGAGPTPFSRMGDGRCAIGPALREYVVSEGMAGLGIPTTRALAVVATGERVMRERPRPGAVLTRIAESHVRVGTFQYFRVRDDVDALRALADHVIARNHPAAAADPFPYRALLRGMIGRTAALVARWLMVGFIHGVMNTDNVSVAGETIDYGPCAFLDAYHPGTVMSSIDQAGRYAFGNQPSVAQWNLTRLAEAMLPLLADDRDKGVEIAREELADFGAVFNAAYGAGRRAKLGLAQAQDDDGRLAQDLLDRMAEAGADYTLTFRALSDAADGSGTEAFRAQFAKAPDAIEAWLANWAARVGAEGGFSPARAAAMRAVNPVYIPRNHLVEEALDAAENGGDLLPLDRLLEALSEPFRERAGFERYKLPPEPHEIVQATFCGT